VGHEPWAVMRLPLPFSLIPLYLVQRSRVFCILLYTFVLSCFARLLSRPPALCLLRQEPRTSVYPSSIHFPATAPHPPLCFPLSQLRYCTSNCRHAGHLRILNYSARSSPPSPQCRTPSSVPCAPLLLRLLLLYATLFELTRCRE
jgi:hypothetical protein